MRPKIKTKIGNLNSKGSFSVTKRLFYKYLRIIDAVYDEAKLDQENGNIHTKVVDPAHVCMLETWLDESAFEEIDFDRNIGISTKRVKSFMSNFKYDDLMKINIINSSQIGFDGNKTDREYMNIKANGYNKDLPLLDTEGMTEPSVPTLEHKVKFNLNNEVIRNILEMGVTDHIRIIVDEDSVFIESARDDDRVYFDSEEADMDLELDWNGEPEPQESLFADDYLKVMTHALPKKTDLLISLKEEYPMKLEFSVEDDDIDGYFLMAPRIESD